MYQRIPIITTITLLIASLVSAEYPPIIFTKPSWGIRKIQKEAFERHLKEIRSASNNAVIHDTERTNNVVVSVVDNSTKEMKKDETKSNPVLYRANDTKSKIIMVSTTPTAN